jgi:hypothetical protein
MRLELPDGRFAVIRDVVTHGADKAIQRAAISAGLDKRDSPDFATTVVVAMTLEWNLIAPDGTTLPISPEGCEAAEMRYIDLIETACLEAYTGRPDPKATGEKSPS